MAIRWLDEVASCPGIYDPSEIRRLAKSRQIFRFRPPNSKNFIIPGFQMQEGRVSPWVAPLLGALVWIEDKTLDRDASGFARAKWLYRRRSYLSELSLACIGHWPRGYQTTRRSDIFEMALIEASIGRSPRSFADIFTLHPRLVIDYQYRLQGVRWDAFEYQM